MITIERSFLKFKMKHYYFVSDDVIKQKQNVHVKAFSHALVPRGNLRMLETLQIELTRTKEQLLIDMHKTTRRQIRRAQEQCFQHIIIENPTDKDLLVFQTFYNAFAKNKKTHTCNAFHMETMKLLREKNALLLTYIQDTDDQVLCYRVYILDKEFVMNLYSASHFRMAESPEMKKLLSHANRFLVWKCICYFKEKGYTLYDMGGLSFDDNIRRFKLGFGGNVTPVYFGYESHSILGELILKIRSLKIALATARSIQ